MKRHSRFKTARGFLVFWCLFIGIGAVAGAWGMLAAPDGSALGMQTLLPYFQVLPFADVLFQNFIFPGFALLTVNGITNLVAATLILAKRKCGIILGGIFGVTLMLWICIQFIIFPANFMSTTYFIFGFLQAATGYAAYVFRCQEEFHVDMADYPDIGKNPERLVVYFSRMGYTRRAALEEAERTGADVYEIIADEVTEGTLGFWWCGRFGMHRWEMKQKNSLPNLESYSHVTICSPIWVFALSSPVRGFCKAASGRIAEADYILTHFQKVKYDNAVREMNSLLGVTATKTVSICTRLGGMGNGKRGTRPF